MFWILLYHRSYLGGFGRCSLDFEEWVFLFCLERREICGWRSGFEAWTSRFWCWISIEVSGGVEG